MALAWSRDQLQRARAACWPPSGVSVWSATSSRSCWRTTSTAPAVARAARQVIAEDCDAVVCAIVRVFDGGTDAVHEVLAEIAATATKPVIGALLGFRAAPEVDWEPDTGEDCQASTGRPALSMP